MPEKLLELSEELQGVDSSIDRDRSRMGDVSNSKGLKAAAVNRLRELDSALDQCMALMGELLRTK